MNKKGFTLVEILAVLVLIGLLLGIAIPGINKISSNMKNKSYNKKVNLIESAAILWGQDNKTRLQANSDCKIDDDKNLSCYKIKVSELLSDNYLDSDNNSGDIINPIDNKSLTNSCVYVYKENNRVYAKYVTDNNEECNNLVPEAPDPVVEPEIVVSPDGNNMSKFKINIKTKNNNQIEKINMISYFNDLNNYRTGNRIDDSFKENYQKERVDKEENYNNNANISGNTLNSLNNFSPNSKEYIISVDLKDMYEECYNDSSQNYLCHIPVNPKNVFDITFIYKFKFTIKSSNSKTDSKVYYYEVQSKLNGEKKQIGEYTNYNTRAGEYIIENLFAIDNNGNITYLTNNTNDNSGASIKMKYYNISSKTSSEKRKLYRVSPNCTLGNYGYPILYDYSFGKSSYYYNYLPSCPYPISEIKIGEFQRVGYYSDRLGSYYDGSKGKGYRFYTGEDLGYFGTVNENLSFTKLDENNEAFLKFYFDTARYWFSAASVSNETVYFDNIFIAKGINSKESYANLNNNDNEKVIYLRENNENDHIYLSLLYFKKSVLIKSSKFV